MGPCLVFHPVYACPPIDVQLSHLGDHAESLKGLLAFHSLRFLQAGYHPCYLHGLFILLS